MYLKPRFLKNTLSSGVLATILYLKQRANVTKKNHHLTSNCKILQSIDQARQSVDHLDDTKLRAMAMFS